MKKDACTGSHSRIIKHLAYFCRDTSARRDLDSLTRTLADFGGNVDEFNDHLEKNVLMPFFVD
jgi:hypothetical protein